MTLQGIRYAGKIPPWGNQRFVHLSLLKSGQEQVQLFQNGLIFKGEGTVGLICARKYCALENNYFVHSFQYYLGSTCCVPSTVLESEHAAGNRLMPSLTELKFCWEGEKVPLFSSFLNVMVTI